MSWSNFNPRNLAFVGVLLGVGTAIVAISGPQRTPGHLMVMWVAAFFAVSCLALLAKLNRRRDLAPDYLGRCQSSFFERDGFCFAITLDREEEMAVFTVMYQTRYMGSSVARIALRPAGSKLATISPEIACGPGAFGVAKFPVAIPAQHQGKAVTFEIGVETTYPQGRGREIRFRRGRPVHHDAGFGSFGVVMKSMLHSLAGHLVIYSATAVRLTLPTGVSEYVADDAGHSEELWSLPKNEPLWYAMER